MLNDEVIIFWEKIKLIYYFFNENYYLVNWLLVIKEELIKILNCKVELEMCFKWVEEVV